MDSSQVRSLFERLVYQVVIESNSEALKSCVVPAQYESETMTLVVSEDLCNGDMVRASFAALLHYDYNHKEVSTTLFTCREIAAREYRHLGAEDIRFLKKFLEDKIFQQRFIF